MNILLIYNKKDEKLKNRASQIKEYIESNKEQYNIKCVLRQGLNVDLYIIISNNIDEIKKYSEKINDKEKIIILTSNINSGHILECIEITDNICYLKNKITSILDRINKIYEKKDKKNS